MGSGKVSLNKFYTLVTSILWYHKICKNNNYGV